MKIAGIIGGLDFLGCDITLKFLSENYRVKALVPILAKNYKPVIHTGLKAGDNLQILEIDMNNHVQLTSFIKDCDCLIHCGRPFELDVKTKDGPVYVPLISDTGGILNALRKAPVEGKIIFLSSVGIFNKDYSKNNNEALKASSRSKMYTRDQAFYHSEKIINNTLGTFSGNQIEILIVAPAVVQSNMLIHTRESTMAGLQFLFSNKIDHDKVFSMLASKYLLDTMLEVDEVPDRVFNSVQSAKELAKYSFLHE